MDWLKKHIAIVTAVLLHSTLAIGLCAVLVGVVIAAMWIRHSGWLEKAVPPPATIAPIKIRIHGPSMIVRGGSYAFAAEVNGPGGIPEWSVLPVGAGRFYPLGNDGKTVEFITLTSNSLAIFASVGGPGNQTTHDHLEVEVLDVAEPAPPAPQPVSVQPVAQPTMVMQHPEPPPPATADVLATGALELVESDDRAAEARIVAGCIRSVVGRLKTGLMPPGSDVVEEIGKQVDAAMPERARKWATFIVSLDTILNNETASGHVSAASKAPALLEVADVLQSQ